MRLAGRPAIAGSPAAGHPAWSPWMSVLAFQRIVPPPRTPDVAHAHRSILVFEFLRLLGITPEACARALSVPRARAMAAWPARGKGLYEVSGPGGCAGTPAGQDSRPTSTPPNGAAHRTHQGREGAERRDRRVPRRGRGAHRLPLAVQRARDELGVQRSGVGRGRGDRGHREVRLAARADGVSGAPSKNGAVMLLFRRARST